MGEGIQRAYTHTFLSKLSGEEEKAAREALKHACLRCLAPKDIWCFTQVPGGPVLGMSFSKHLHKLRKDQVEVK